MLPGVACSKAEHVFPVSTYVWSKHIHHIYTYIWQTAQIETQTGSALIETQILPSASSCSSTWLSRMVH